MACFGRSAIACSQEASASSSLPASACKLPDLTSNQRLLVCPARWFERLQRYEPADAFRTGRYPLLNAIAVVYPRSNDRSPIGEKFAALLATREGQKLLAQTGLVPLESSLEK